MVFVCDLGVGRHGPIERMRGPVWWSRFEVGSLSGVNAGSSGQVAHAVQPCPPLGESRTEHALRNPVNDGQPALQCGPDAVPRNRITNPAFWERVQVSARVWRPMQCWTARDH